jgi:hypothetical protein
MKSLIMTDDEGDSGSDSGMEFDDEKRHDKKNRNEISDDSDEEE